MFKELKRIFSSVKTLLVSIGIASVIFLSLEMMPNTKLFSFFVKQFGFFSSEVRKIFFAYIQGIPASRMPHELVLVGILSVLIAVNLVIFIHFFKRQRSILKAQNSSLSIIGMILGLFGAGCASCGTLLLAPVLSSLGIAGITQRLPFAGLELSYLGIALILLSIMLMLRKLSEPMVCE